jgi:ribosome-binding protein aMBF1 (putative translation factor)
MTRSLAEIQASVARRHARRLRERMKQLARSAQAKQARQALRQVEAEARTLEREQAHRQGQTFGQAVRAARFAKGWTVGELAYRVGMTRKAVQNLEYGCLGTSRAADFERELGVALVGLPVRRARVPREPPQSASAIRSEPQAGVVNYDRQRSSDYGVAEHSSIERELALGLRVESARSFRGCNACHGMSWRRHWNGCVGCKLPYAPEPVARPEAQYGSSSIMCENAA